MEDGAPVLAIDLGNNLLVAHDVGETRAGDGFIEMDLRLQLITGRDCVLLFQGLAHGIAIKGFKRRELVGRNPDHDFWTQALFISAAPVPKSSAMFSQL